jgi:hypothetical protein
MVASITTFLAAGKFGVAPTVKNGTNAACQLQPRANAAGLITNDPSGAGGWCGVVAGVCVGAAKAAAAGAALRVVRQKQCR